MKIELQKIRFGYPKGKRVLDNVSFEIQSGEFAFVIGLNGSGKSTLLKIIARILEPQSGEVLFDGENSERFSAKEFARTLAYVPQNYSPAFPFSVFDFVATGRTPYLNFYGILKNRDKEIVEKNLLLLGIKNLAEKSITEISGGELRRVMIARALSQEPKILLLDEPSAFLDIEHQISIFEFLKKLNQEQGLTILTVSHDLNLTGMFAESVILLENGEATKFPKKEILTSEKIKKHFGVNAFISEKEENIHVTITRRK